MKIIVRSSSLLLTFVAILSNAKMCRVEAALRRGIVGRLRIGMSLKELLQDAQPATVDQPDEKTVKLYFDPDTGHPPALSADLTNGSVSQFQVLSENFRTDIGIGVGATLEDLANFYEISWREPDYAYVDALKMRFEIRDGKVASILVS
jgi:hypothetical protein